MAGFFVGIVLVFGSLAYFNSVLAESEVVLIERQWVPETPPGVATLAAYMNITNISKSLISVIGVSSNVAKMTKLHEVKIENDVMQMRKMSDVIIEPGKTLELKAGGSHVMLMGVQESFLQDDEIEIELKDLPAVKVKIPVKKDL